jgi:hypothetical protein
MSPDDMYDEMRAEDRADDWKVHQGHNELQKDCPFCFEGWIDDLLCGKAEPLPWAQS